MDSYVFINSNVMETQVLLDASITKGIDLFTNMSTDEVCGAFGKDGTFAKESSLNPNSPYSMSNASADMLGRAYHRSFGLLVIMIRASNYYRLRHVTPINNVGEDFSLFRAQQQHGGRLRDLANKIRMLWFRLFPFSGSVNLEKYYSLYTAGSQAEAELLKKSFGNVNVKVTGQPRNDVLCGSFDEQLATQSTKKRVLYLPTHRFEGRHRIVPYIVKGINEVDSLLGDLNAHMIIKLHFAHRHENADLARALKDFTNIRVLDDEATEDIYPLLRSTDILITDYSSVYVDYLLTTRPIIFFPFDLDDYVARERPFNFDYMSITPGPKCWDWHGVAMWIKRFCEDPTPYLEERLKLKELFHEFDDGRNCERVVAAIKELLLGLKNHNS